jgi:HMW1C N-terminal
VNNNKPTPGVHEILNVQLETFERAALLRRPAEAGELLLELVNRLRTGADFIGFPIDDPLKTKLYSRLAAAIVAMLADPGFQFSTQGWSMFATCHAVFEGIFESSVFDTAEHLVPALVSNPAERDAKKFQFDDARAMAKFLLTYCLNGQTDMNFDELFSKTAKTTLPLWLGMLSNHVCLHPNSHERRERLVDTGKYFDDLVLPDGLLPALSDAYMYCSYLTRPDKHRLKDTYGRLIRNMVGKLIALPSAAEIKRRRELAVLQKRDYDPQYKPTILVPLEWFNSLHAMYRCYADAVGQLRPHFRLVAACKESTLDEKARELFDDFLWLPEGNVAIDKVVEDIAKLAPDIIFYPSVGMALWWVATAQLRLAPIQVMGLGHPASSHSPAMDYVLADKGMIKNTTHFTERVLELPPNAFRFLARADTAIPPPPHVRDADDPVRIAVPSMVVKVTVPYLQMCKRIAERAGRKVEFHFFPNVLGLWRFQAKRQLDRWFPTGAVIHHRYGYAQFLEALNACDLMLSTFPFGGTNSLVDAFLCGVPVVCLEVPDGHVHERCDAWALRRVGLDDLIAQSIEEYENTAVHLIQDNASCQLHSDHLRGQNVDAIFHGPLTGDAKGAVLRAFEYAYAHHEEIKATDERVIPWEVQR